MYVSLCPLLQLISQVSAVKKQRLMADVRF